MSNETQSLLLKKEDEGGGSKGRERRKEEEDGWRTRKDRKEKGWREGVKEEEERRGSSCIEILGYSSEIIGLTTFTRHNPMKVLR